MHGKLIDSGLKKPKLAQSIAIEENRNFVDNDQFYIYGEFDFTILKFIIPKLMTSIEEARNEKTAMLRFHINSPGGYCSVLENLLSLFEIAKKDDIIIQTNVYSYAYSCGSLLAAAGTKGYRFVSPFAEHLVHLGATWGGPAHNEIEAERESEVMKRHFEFVKGCYRKYANVKNLNKVIRDDCYYIYGKDIIENGLADELLF